MANRIALISGAGSGIGKAVAKAVADLYDIFIFIGRDINKLEVIGEELRKTDSIVYTKSIDLSSIKALDELANWINGQFDHINLLVHSAGVIKLATVMETLVEDLDWHYSINLRAPFLLTQNCLPLLRAGQGEIVFINSSAGLVAKPHLSAYCATKSALKAFADSLRAEENVYGIRVLNVYPGKTATPMQESLFISEEKEYLPEIMLQPEDIAQAIASTLLLPKTAELTDLSIRGMNKS